MVASSVVTDRTARQAKDAITRAVLERNKGAGIAIAYQTYAVTGSVSARPDSDNR